jgi:AGZA family xanthine/uracil permease-like MFS transporter
VVAAGITTTSLLPNNQVALQVLHALYGGFIITSLLWASALAALIDRQLIRGGVLFLVCGGLTLFGVIHSPLPNSEMFVIWPGDQPLPGTLRDPRQIQDVLVWAASYAGVAIFLFALAAWHRAHPDQSPDSAAPDNAHDA